MKKTALVLGVIATLAVIAYSQRATIAGRIMDVGLERMMGANLIADLDDGLHLTLCGAGGPMPAPKASGPCVAVVAGVGRAVHREHAAFGHEIVHDGEDAFLHLGSFWRGLNSSILELLHTYQCKYDHL